MVLAAAGTDRNPEALSLADLQSLPLDVRSRRLLAACRADVLATVTALQDAEGGDVLRAVDEERLAWAVAYNVDGSLPLDATPARRSVQCYGDRWPRLTSWSTIWATLVKVTTGGAAGDCSSLLAELASSVACEHRDDWQNPPSRPVDVNLANRAFEWVYRRNRMKVLGDVHRSFGARAGEPETIAEEAWARVFCDYWSTSARRRFLGLARISTFVCQVARHVAVDALRARAHDAQIEDAELDAEFPRRTPRLDEIGIATDQDSRILTDQLTALIRDGLKPVPLRARLVAELIWFRHLQAKHVSDILGISEAAVSQHLKRARQTVLAALAPALDPQRRDVNPEPGRATD